MKDVGGLHQPRALFGALLKLSIEDGLRSGAEQLLADALKEIEEKAEE